MIHCYLHKNLHLHMWGMLVMAAILAAQHVDASGQVFFYEGTKFPDMAGWEIGQNFCSTEEWIDRGWFYQHVESCDGFPPPGGQQSSYERNLDEFVGVARFFIEWRMKTTGERSELPWGGPATLSAWSTGPVDYHFSIAQDQADLNRDNSLPIPVADYEPQVPHTFRLELVASDSYAWYLDGEIVDAGIPKGPYPSHTAQVRMRTKSAFLENTTSWDYIRWGRTPIDASGDFDSDGDHDLRDFYFLHECVAGVDRPVMLDGGVDPGCLWADVNEDDRVDLLDFGEFQILASDSPD